jgi:hypothetical protein
MKIRSLVVATLLGALLAAPIRARADNAFMGHYGYMLTYSNDYSAKPSFHGVMEVVDIFPLTCKGLGSRMACAKIGMVELYAIPKSLVATEYGPKDLNAYVTFSLGDAKKAGIETQVTRVKRAGFPATIIRMPNHPQPLNTMLLIEGTKVYYRFKYNDKTGAKAARAMIDSLKEIQPHDNPPETP